MNTLHELPVQYTGSEQRKSHNSQQRKIRHIHGVHSATLLLSSIDIDRSGMDWLSPKEFLLMKAFAMYTNSFPNSTMNIPYFPLLRAVTFPLFRAGTVSDPPPLHGTMLS